MLRLQYRWSRTWAALALLAGVVTLSACGESSPDADDAPAASAAPTPRVEAPAKKNAQPAEPAVVKIRDDTALAAIETWIAGVKTGQIDAALAVVDPKSKGAAQLAKLKAGWNRAKQAGAPIALARAALAGEIDALTYHQISDDGKSAVFRFSKPTKPDQPWEVRAVRTPEGWRVIPPDSGMPQG